MNDDKKKEEKPTMSQRFFRACLLILGGIVLIWIALELLAQFWGWIVLIAGLALAGWVTYRIIKARQDRW